MSQASVQIARQYANAAKNKKDWGDVLYNVKVYGAAGDGVTDDTEAIQAAIDAAIDAGGGVVFFPIGSYLASQLSINNNVKLQAQNRNATLKQMNNTNDNFFSVTGIGKHIEFEGLIFDGNHTNQESESTQNIIRCDVTGGDSDPFMVEVYNCKFMNLCYSAIFFIGQSNGSKKEYLYVEDNEFYGGNDGSTSYDPRYISVSSASKAWISKNTFDFGSVPTGTGRAGVTIQTGDKTQEFFARFIVSQNEFRNIGRFASNSLGCVDMYTFGNQCVVSENVFYDSYSGCINVKTDSKNIIITENQIFNTKNAQTSIAVNTETSGFVYYDFIISKNIVDSGTGRGISFSTTSGNVKNVQIEGNTVKDSGSHGIQVKGTENLIVGNNIIENVTGTALWCYDVTGLANIVNNIINNATSFGIFMDAEFTEANLNIIGNNIKSVVRYGIYVKDADASDIKSANVSHNRVDTVAVSTNSIGIVAENMDYLTLIGNIVTGATTSEYYTAGVGAKTTNLGNSWNP